MQDQGKGLQPIAFISKKMSKAERNYEVHDQELLAVVSALKTWRHYLAGAMFKLQTDHKSLEFLLTQPHLNSRQMRWKDTLIRFGITLSYIKGEENVVADALSRRADLAALAVRVTRSTTRAALHADPSTTTTPPTPSSANHAPDLHDDTPLVSQLWSTLQQAATSDREYQQLLQRVQKGGDSKYSIRDRLLLFNHTRVLVPADSTLRTQLIAELHDTPLSGHLGKDKTISRAKRRFFWPGMDSDITRYVTSCDACQRNKPSNARTMGRLMPLPIPRYPWQVMSMDLITGLPRTRRGHDAIVVFTDKLSKLAHTAPTTTTVSAAALARLMIREVVRLHGVPEAIISDRDPRFTAHFWRAAWTRLGSRLDMSTAFHPQTDGQTERANRTFEEMIRPNVNFQQDDWDEHLDAIELAYNDSIHASTGFTPFYLTYGREVSTPIDHALATGCAPPTDNPAADHFVKSLTADLERARTNLERAQQRQAHYANQRRRHATFAVGDRVLLSTEHLQIVSGDDQHRTAKFLPKYIGPFKIKRVVNDNAYELDLPAQLQIHPVLNISRLRPYRDGRALFPDRPAAVTRPPPEVHEDGSPVYEVKGILAKRHRRNKIEYLVEWEGYPIEEATWEPATNLAEDNAQEAIDEFEQRVLEDQDHS